MNQPEASQPDLFGTRKPESTFPPITIELSGLGPIPSFKNRKLIRSWLDKAALKMEFREGRYWVRRDTIKIRSMLYLEPELQTWMDRATSLIESQLRCALATTAGAIQTAASPRSLIATLLPLDDAWTSFAELIVRSGKCEPGQEGATIRIERL